MTLDSTGNSKSSSPRGIYETKHTLHNPDSFRLRVVEEASRTDRDGFYRNSYRRAWGNHSWEPYWFVPVFTRTFQTAGFANLPSGSNLMNQFLHCHQVISTHRLLRG